jgi:hypothetical protein
MLAMNRGIGIATLARSGLVLLLFWGIGVESTGAGQIVSGSYSVKETIELGTQVRVTLQIHLTNAGEQRLLLTQMSLQNHLRLPQVSEERSAVILEPHVGTEVTRQFTIDKDEFESMRHSTRPRLALRIHGADWRGDNRNDCADAPPRMRLSHE